jgi:hypothetical protein
MTKRRPRKSEPPAPKRVRASSLATCLGVFVYESMRESAAYFVADIMVGEEQYPAGIEMLADGYYRACIASENECGVGRGADADMALRAAVRSLVTDVETAYLSHRQRLHALEKAALPPPPRARAKR